MAIPIAEGSINKQFQAPRAAQGKAADLSRNIQQIGQQAINAIQGIQQFSNAQEEMTANDAITLYSTQMNDLNLELRSKKGLDAVNFESEYKKKASQYHSEFINRLGGLNSNVQNSAVNKINSFNTSNKNEFVLYTEGQRMEAEKESSNAAKQALSSLHLAQFDNTFVDNKAVFYDATAALDEMVLKDCLREGMASDPTYVKTRQEEERVVFAGQVVKKLNRQGDYRRSMRFIEDIKGQIPEPDRVVLGHDASLNQLKVEVLSNPEKFANKKFTDWYVTDKYFPYLEELERKQLLASLQKTNKEKSTLNGQQKFEISALNEADTQEAADIFYRLGIAGEIAEFEGMYGKEALEMTKDVKNDINKYNVSTLQTAMDQLIIMKNLQVAFDPITGGIVKEKGNIKYLETPEQVNAAKQAGYQVVTKATNTTLNKAIVYLSNEIARLDREDKYGNVTDRQAFFKGRDATVLEVLDMNVGKMSNELGDVPWWREFLFNEKDQDLPSMTYSTNRFIARQAADKWAKENGIDLASTKNSELTKVQRQQLSAVIANALLKDAPEGVLKEFGVDRSLSAIFKDDKAALQKKVARDFFNIESDWKRPALDYILSFGNPLQMYKNAQAQAELAGIVYENIDIEESSKKAQKVAVSGAPYAMGSNPTYNRLQRLKNRAYNAELNNDF